ncbi:hypothetical protein WN944_011915 [Citrus x changshan-huyou]|uniref:Uncharacterized protein n=1 Tax=Citrus x changshan-huyou TaxID=2935761 RepID=A0AAP0MUA0_9ROSI
MSKSDAKDPETLANLVVCSLHQGKSTSRYLKFMSLAHLSVMGCHWFSSLCNIQGGGEVSQLKLTHPDHMLVKRASSGDESFERALQSVA